MTDQQFAAWLKDSTAIRCILVEAEVKTGGSVVTRYLSNKGYVTGNTDSPANTLYSSRIVGGIKITQSLSIDGNVSMSFGDIELNNLDGTLDTWLDDLWSNRSIKIFIGDVTWVRSDFRQVFTGITTGIDSRKRDRINIKISDKLQRLNYPVTENKFTSSREELNDTQVPLCFGECHNVSPVLVDPAISEYQVHDGPIEDIIEVRDNGVPVQFTKFLTTGKFRLSQAPVGTITASVQGDKPSTYSNDIVSILKRIMKDYGKAGQRFVDADLDLAALSAFATANPQPVGVYLTDRTNVVQLCSDLVASVGARLTVTPAGLVSLVKLSLPQASPGTTVTSADMVDRSLEVSQMVPVKASVKVGYCKNWTVQNSLTTALPTDHLALYKDEWLTVTRTDTAAAGDYNLFTDPTQEDTYLLVTVDAITEANRRLNMFNVQRKVMKYTGFYHLITEQLGASQTIQHTRFGLSAGKTGQIISVSMDWISPTVDFEVLI